MPLRFPRAAVLRLVLCLAAGLHARGPEPEIPPPGFKVAFLGDQGLGPDSEAVLKLVKSEGADMLVHLGDFDYTYNPQAWEDQTDRVLGRDFPQIAVVGNHDLGNWRGAKGYSFYVTERLRRMGVIPNGEVGVKCSFRYKGIFFVLTAPGLMGYGHAAFIRSELDRDTTAWRISAWHVNQRLMQVGGKYDEAGWDVYEESRRGGAIIATAHEHSYSRTHLLNGMATRDIASKDNLLRLQRGRSFAFVAGLGGGDVRPQLLKGDWWASVYTSTQGARPGALFATFHVDEDPRKAAFYFKAIDGTVPDRFEVRSELERPIRPGISFRPERSRLEIDPVELGIPPGGRVLLVDSHGRVHAKVDPLRGQVSLPLPPAGLLFMRIESAGRTRLRQYVLLP